MRCGVQAVRVKPHINVVNVRFAHIMGFCSESEEYFCFEDFVTGRNLEELVAEGEGGLYDGTCAEVSGLLYPRPRLWATVYATCPACVCLWVFKV